MRKHKKTRKEKLIADLHRKLQLQKRVATVNSAPQYRIEKTFRAKQTIQTDSIVVKSLSPYLLHDFLKTLFLTFGIVVIQVVLFALLKTHTIVFPFIRF